MVQGDVVTFVEQMSESYRSFAQGKGLEFHLLGEISSLQMDYDPDKLLRIISNLLSNAIKYTPQAGHIYLRYGQVRRDMGTSSGQPCFHLLVRDTGRGVPSDQLPYIFDRFYQVDKDKYQQEKGSRIHMLGGSSGVGLALTKELVELMGGQIEVQSSLGEGTTFRIFLPIHRRAPLQAADDLISLPDELLAVSSAMDHKDPGSATGFWDAHNGQHPKPQLLIVEDNPGIQEYLVACLEDHFELRVASDGQMGIDQAIEHVPDLIVSDVMMPRKDGFELCDLLKRDERTSHIPIILLTARGDVESRIAGLERGADAYLAKPFEERELLVRLKKLWELRQQLQKRYGSLAPVAGAQQGAEAERSPEEAFLHRLHGVLLDHLSDSDFSGAQLCRAMTLSRTQLYNKIKALTGKSTSIYMRSFRLQHARRLLESTNKSVTDVAFEVGFKDLSYFSRTFSEEFGQSPTKVKKN